MIPNARATITCFALPRTGQYPALGVNLPPGADSNRRHLPFIRIPTEKDDP
jgi:hypothetical protein